MKILILKEHHGTRYLDVSTSVKLEKVALSVVKARFGGGNPYYPMEERIPPEPLDFTEEDIKKMPESLKTDAESKLRRYQQLLQEYEWVEEFRQTVRRCIKTGDGKLAWKILNQRRRYEDEGFEVVCVEKEY